MKRNVCSIAPALTPLPKLLATSSTSPPPVHPMMDVEIHKDGAPSVQPMTDVEIYLNEDGSFKVSGPTFEKGTTGLAFIFDEGIMLSFDHSSKSSESATNFVQLNSHMLATISGGSEFLLRDLRDKCQQHEKAEGRETSVAEALKWLTKAVTDNKEELPIGILIAVWNESERGLYRINGQGVLVEDHILSTGSGSAASVLLLLERKHNMSINEAADLAKTAICMAAYRAPHSGDIFSVYHLGCGGCKKLVEGDIEEWHKMYNSPKWKYVVIGPGW